MRESVRNRRQDLTTDPLRSDGADSTGDPRWGSEAARPAAEAVELAHNFSLVHDNVIDRDLTRGHRPTAWTVFGLGAASLAGDALLTLADDVLAASGNPAAQCAAQALSSAMLGRVDGQMADLSFEQRGDVTLPECVDMAEQKTALVLSCACAVGALVRRRPSRSGRAPSQLRLAPGLRLPARRRPRRHLG